MDTTLDYFGFRMYDSGFRGDLVSGLIMGITRGYHMGCSGYNPTY